MSKKSLADAKRLDNINKTYVCDDGIITKRRHKLKKAPEIVPKDGEESKPPKALKPPTAWALHLKAFYTKAKAKDPKYDSKYFARVILPNKKLVCFQLRIKHFLI